MTRAEQVWYRRQAAINSNTWLAWRVLDGTLTAGAMALNSLGRLEIFGVNTLGQAWHRSQAAPGVNVFSAWEPFGLPATLRSVSAELNADGLVEVFALTSTGQIWHRWQTAPSSATYTPWVQLDGALTSIAVARNGDGTLQLFGVNRAGQIWRRDGGPGVNNWFSWSQLDDPPAVGTLRSLAAETNADGRVELFAVNTSGQLWHRWQASAGSDTYSAWAQLDGTLRP